MKIINVCLCCQEVLFIFDLQDGIIYCIIVQVVMQIVDVGVIDVQGWLVILFFVELYIYFDVIFIVGELEWNCSGILFEGIICWSQCKVSIILEDICQWVLKIIGMLCDFGVQYVCIYVDVIDLLLVVLQVLLVVK